MVPRWYQNRFKRGAGRRRKQEKKKDERSNVMAQNVEFSVDLAGKERCDNAPCQQMGPKNMKKEGSQHKTEYPPERGPLLGEKEAKLPPSWPPKRSQNPKKTC